MFKSKNFYVVVVFVVFDCVYVFDFYINSEQPVPLHFIISVLFYSSKCNGLCFSLLQLREAKGSFTSAAMRMSRGQQAK